MVADLFLFCYERDFMMSLSGDKQADIINSHYKNIGYNIDVLQQTVCLAVNLIAVGNFAFLFNYMR